MRKIFLTLSLLVIATAVMAVPSKPGQWKTIKLTDGTEVRAQLAGDEHVHFWMAEDGTKYVKDGDSETYVVIDNETVAARSAARRSKMKTGKRLRAYPLFRSEKGYRDSGTVYRREV